MYEAPVDLPRLGAEIFQIMAVRRVQRAGQQQRVIETLSSLMQLKRGILSKPLILSSFEHGKELAGARVPFVKIFACQRERIRRALGSWRRELAVVRWIQRNRHLADVQEKENRKKDEQG